MTRAGGVLVLMLGTFICRADEAAFWSGQSAGFEVVWSAQDLIARHVADGATAYSAAADFKQATRKLHPDSAEPAACTIRRRTQLSSLVGPYLGLAENTYESCPDWLHPSEETGLRTLALCETAKGGKPTGPAGPQSLTDLFPAPAVASALRENVRVRQWMGGGELPTRLDELLESLSGGVVPAPGECFEIPHDLLRRFVLRGIRDGKVLVDLGLPGAGNCRGLLTVLSLEIMPRHGSILSKQLAAAQAGHEGTVKPVVGAEAMQPRTEFSLTYRASR